jgi:hypothetical protein
MTKIGIAIDRHPRYRRLLFRSCPRYIVPAGGIFLLLFGVHRHVRRKSRANCD